MALQAREDAEQRLALRSYEGERVLFQELPGDS